MIFYIQIGFGIILLLLYNICTVTAIYRYRKNKKDKSVWIPPFFLVLGWISSMLFTVLAILSVIFSWGSAATVVLLLLSLLGGSLVIACCNCWIQYDQKGFAVRRFWGNRGHYTYDDIVGFSSGTKDSTIYLKKGKIHIDQYAKGKEDFLAISKENCQSRSNNALKFRTHSRYKQDDFFHGNIENPGEFIFIFFLILVFFLGAGIFISVTGLQSMKESELETATIVFSAYQEEDENLICFSADTEEEWILYEYQTYTEHTEELLAGIENQEAFTLLYHTYQTEDNTAYRQIYACTGKDGTMFLNLAQANAQERSDFYPVIMIFAVIILAWIAFAAFFTHIVRNAPDHPKLMPLLVKKGYIIRK